MGPMFRGVYNFLKALHERQNAPDCSGEDFTQAVAKECSLMRTVSRGRTLGFHKTRESMNKGGSGSYLRIGEVWVVLRGQPLLQPCLFQHHQ